MIHLSSPKSAPPARPFQDASPATPALTRTLWICSTSQGASRQSRRTRRPSTTLAPRRRRVEGWSCGVFPPLVLPSYPLFLPTRRHQPRWWVNHLSRKRVLPPHPCRRPIRTTRVPPGVASPHRRARRCVRSSKIVKSIYRNDGKTTTSRRIRHIPPRWADTSAEIGGLCNGGDGALTVSSW